MKIVLGSHYFYPHIGGIESVVESHASRLTDRGHDVTVITTDIQAESRQARRDGYVIHRYGAWNPAERLGAPYPIPNPRSVRQHVKNMFTQSDVDIIHVHGMNYLTTAAILRYAPSDCPTFLHQHTPFVEYPLPFEIIEKINDRTVGRWNLKQADRVFCVSRNIERYVSTISEEVRTEIMLNGVDTERFHPRNKSEELGDYGDMDTPIFFSLSRLSQKKGVDVLLEASRELESKNRGIKIVVAGDGPMREDVAQVAEDSHILEYVGRLSEEKLPKYYATADAFLFTSRSGEAFPTLTMMEAYASGTPVITSKLVEEYSGVSDGVNSILVEPGNPSELVRTIMHLSADEKRLKQMGTKARKTAESRFSIEDRIDRLEDCYESLLKHRN